MTMPPVVTGDWLLIWLFEAGPTSPSGMGYHGLSWTELRHWRACTRTQANDWEMRALRQLSAAYAAAHHAAEKPDCPAYWLSPELTTASVSKSEAAGQQIQMLFGAMAKRHPS